MRLVSLLVSALVLLSVSCLAGDPTHNEASSASIDVASLQSKVRASLEEGNADNFFKAVWKIYASEKREKIESARAFIALDESGVVFDDARIQLLRSVMCGNIVLRMADGTISDEEPELYRRVGLLDSRETANGTVKLFTYIDDPRVKYLGSRSLTSLVLKGRARVSSLGMAKYSCSEDVYPLVMLALQRLKGNAYDEIERRVENEQQERLAMFQEERRTRKAWAWPAKEKREQQQRALDEDKLRSRVEFQAAIAALRSDRFLGSTIELPPTFKTRELVGVLNEAARRSLEWVGSVLNQRVPEQALKTSKETRMRGYSASGLFGGNINDALQTYSAPDSLESRPSIEARPSIERLLTGDTEQESRDDPVIHAKVVESRSKVIQRTEEITNVLLLFSGTLMSSEHVHFSHPHDAYETAIATLEEAEAIHALYSSLSLGLVEQFSAWQAEDEALQPSLKEGVLKRMLGLKYKKKT